MIPVTILQNQLDYNEIRVYYDKDLMDAFAVPTDWLAVCRQSPGIYVFLLIISLCFSFDKVFI